MPLGKVLKKLLEGVEEEVVRPRKPREIEKVTRHIPAQTKREAVAKHNGKCAFPNCKNHHHIAHAGLIKNEEKAPALWGVKAWGFVLAAYDFALVVFLVFRPCLAH